MSTIYAPAGDAGEYCRLAVNLFVGCNHGCTYCYGASVLRASKQKFMKPIPTKGTLENIRKDAQAYSGGHVLLCFLTDPYNGTENGETREALKILVDNGCIPVILTKAGRRSMRDFDILLEGKGWYGTTLTFDNEEDSREYEPYAALPRERIDTLWAARQIGIKTWASLEPIIKPEQTLKLIGETTDFCGHYKIGKLNYQKVEYNISDVVAQIRSMLRRYDEITEVTFEEGTMYFKKGSR